MKILMLAWEYPPKNIGGLSTHVYFLSQALYKLGHDIYIITCGEDEMPAEENDNGVHIYRVKPYQIDTCDFTKFVMNQNFAMIEEGIKIIYKIGRVDIIHGHDWLVAFAAKVLKSSCTIPMVSTIHATEYGRNNGIRTEMQRYISSTEHMLTYESWKVIVCSHYMRQQLSDLFKTPWEKMWIIPNGVDIKSFELEFDWLNFRRKYASDDEKIIFFVGRHVFEKGIHLLIEAAGEVLSNNYNIKFVIGGKGPMTDELKNKVKIMGIENKFEFIGYIDDEIKNKLYKVSNAAVFPSLYEPFGIVALEAMAAGCPVIVSDTGGLSEIIQHRVNGIKTIPSNSNSIKNAIIEIIKNEVLVNSLRENGLKTVNENYSWKKIAELTVSMYDMVKRETVGTEWEVKEYNNYQEIKKEKIKDKNAASCA